MKKKKTVTPVITGIHPTERKKKLLPLHYHPDAIRENCKNLITMAEKEESLRLLFEDISTLVNWALDRLPMAAPPQEKGMQPKEATSPTELK